MDLTNTTQAVTESLELFREAMKEQLSAKNINASGKLDDSIEDIMVTSDGFVSGSVRALSYWYYTNYGRGPTVRGSSGKGVVREKIRQWIDDKGIVPRDAANGRKTTKDELAFLIARKIHREGYEAKLYISEVEEQVIPIASDLIEQALFKDLNNGINSNTAVGVLGSI
jgi:hypothetical protein